MAADTVNAAAAQRGGHGLGKGESESTRAAARLGCRQERARQSERVERVESKTAADTVRSGSGGGGDAAEAEVCRGERSGGETRVQRPGPKKKSAEATERKGERAAQRGDGARRVGRGCGCEAVAGRGRRGRAAGGRGGSGESERRKGERRKNKKKKKLTRPFRTFPSLLSLLLRLLLLLGSGAPRAAARPASAR